MSISLPNGTLLAAPSSTAQQYSAAVTRILHLANFSPELKTRDLQTMFRDWENDKGGFRIKWLDDVNALLVFSDAGVAKRAYLSFLLHPPPTFNGQIKPYDRPDAAQIIQSLAARAMGHRASMSAAMHSSSSFSNGHSYSNSIMGPPPLPDSINGQPHPHGRSGSMSGFGNYSLPPKSTRASISNPGAPPSTSTGRLGGFHHRSGSASSFSRQPLSGVLNFNLPSSTANRLPTHSESSVDPSRASSSDGEPVVVVEPAVGVGGSAWKANNVVPGGQPANGFGARRDSVSAEKALREVEKALASVEAQG